MAPTTTTTMTTTTRRRVNPRRSTRGVTVASNGREEEVEEEEEKEKEKGKDDDPTARRTRRRTTSSSVSSRSARSRSRNRRDEEEDDEKTETETYEVDGKEYGSYAAMVQAKRERNQEMLRRSGLLDLQPPPPPPAATRQRSQDKEKSSPTARRKSNRLAGVETEHAFVANEAKGKYVIGTVPSRDKAAEAEAAEAEAAVVPVAAEEEKEEYFRGRVHNGADLTVEEALLAAGGDDEEEQEEAVHFMTKTMAGLATTSTTRTTMSRSSASTSETVQDVVDALSVERTEKVVPRRIYSIVCHPSTSALVVAAGDKGGHVGIWNVDGYRAEAEEKSLAETKTTSPTGVVSSSNLPRDTAMEVQDNDRGHVSCFRVHGSSVSCMEWYGNSSLLTCSYDCSLRLWDVESLQFRQVFATHPASAPSGSRGLGHGLDQGRHFWIQYATSDPRQPSCYFLSTSLGELWHVDLRTNAMSFRKSVSEKKVNSISLHPNGTTVATAGLDCAVRLWDVRNWSCADDDKTRQKKKKKVPPLATHATVKSINSAFFSPSGSHLLSTTMANQLTLSSFSGGDLQDFQKIRHNTTTGRWLSTFQAKWHDSLNVFVVGSMKQPRCVEIFHFHKDQLTAKELRGDALRAVASRCCFHPNPSQLTLVGGNSSGRVTVAR